MPTCQGRQRLVAGHGRPFGKIFRAAGNLFVDQAGDVGKVIIDPHIHHPHLGPDMTGQHVDPGAAGQEVEHHLRGHFAGIQRNTLFRDAVVSGKGEDDFLRKIRIQGCR